MEKKVTHAAIVYQGQVHHKDKLKITACSRPTNRSDFFQFRMIFSPKFRVEIEESPT